MILIVLGGRCSRTIYLCDDGKDPKKRKWVASLSADVVYVSGRKREPGEMNGKSGNINNVCSQLYPHGCHVPGTELVCIFDADQVWPKSQAACLAPAKVPTFVHNLRQTERDTLPQCLFCTI